MTRCDLFDCHNKHLSSIKCLTQKTPCGWNCIPLKFERSTFKEDRVACNYCNFGCVAQSDKLKAHLKKCQLFIHTQSTQYREPSTSHQPAVIPHQVTATEKDNFDAQSALVFFEGCLPLNTSDKRLKSAMYCTS